MMHPTLLATALASFAGGVMGHGIFFLAQDRYQFSDQQNLLLAIALYIPYVPAALLAGRLAKHGTGRALVLVSLWMGLIALLISFQPPVWAFWLLAPAYNMGAGALWPLLEGSLSVGKGGAELHQAIGRFNLTWALTLAPGLALVGVHPGLALVSVVGTHLLIIGLAPRIQAHPHPVASSHPEWKALLKAARILLPLSYVLLDTLSPLLPGIWGRLGVEASLGAAGSTTWMLARLGSFAVLAQTHRWHGNWGFLWIGAGLLCMGFTAAVLAPLPEVLIAGLAIFGVGQGMIYYAALYYGMETGAGEVEAGGWHEAVIGLGYLGGPFLALMGMGLGWGPLPLVAASVTVGMGVAGYQKVRTRAA
jgi:hypothetical protein